MSTFTILVVDDQPYITAFLEDLLTDEGYRVVTGSNGQTALTLVDAYHPQLVITDVAMPIKDGWQFVQELHARPTSCTLPVIMISAQQHLPFAGSDLDPYTVFLRKPFAVERLLSCVHILLP